jgi:hypothetical protein
MTAGNLFRCLWLCIGILALPPALRAQTADTITLPANIQPSLTDGTMTALEPYAPEKMLHLKIHLADLGDNQDQWFDTIAEWFKDNGMTVTDSGKDRRTIGVETSVQAAEALFHISIDQYALHDMLYYANSQPPSIPVILNGIVTGIDGLDNFPSLRE